MNPQDARTLQRLTLMALFAAASACAASAEPSDERFESSDVTEAPIIGGTKATAYPEAVLIDMIQGGSFASACSGSMIAPRVVLTAGHCVYGYEGFRVTAPFAGNQISDAVAATVYDWKVKSSTVDPKFHDVALIFLGTPIELSSYPAIATAPLKDGSTVVNIGRIQDGYFSSTALFVSPPVTVFDGADIGYPLDYGAVEVIQSGDSGGPDMITGTHTIVAVNSGAGGGTQVLARVDLLAGWIADQVAANGGSGPVDGGDGADDGNDGSDSDPSIPTEAEPNNAYTSANPLGPVVQGGLSGSDQDWFTWSIEGKKSYALDLDPTGDAQLRMWKLVNGKYTQVANTTSTSVAHTSTGSGTYVVALWSPYGESQSYTLTLQK